MINLRYHIVSITAVFLALGIGVTLGSSMIQRYTIETLEDRLDELGERLDRTDGENSILRAVLDERDRLAEQLTEEGLAVLDGHLDEQSVLVLAVQGSDDDLLSEARSSLRAAGAELSGTLVFTTRWDELSEDELDELSEVLGRRFATATIARSFAIRGVTNELAAASGPAPEPEPEPEPEDEGEDEGEAPEGSEEGLEGVTDSGGEGPEVVAEQSPDGDPVQPGDEGEGGEVDDPVPPEPAVPDAEIISSLIDLGYLEFFPERASGPLPRYDTRYVFVADDAAALDDDVVAVPLLEALADLQPAPIVVAGALSPAPPVTSEEADDETDRVAALVAMVRSDDRLRARIGTVDALGEFIGNAALVVSVSELGLGVVEHLGLGDTAQRLLPAGQQ